MQKPKIFIDLDGVVFDTISAIVSLYNEDYKTFPNFKRINPKNVSTWNFTECKCASLASINLYFCTPRFFHRVNLMKHAETIILLLSYQFDITFVSLGELPNLQLKTEWVTKHFPFAKFIGVDLNKYGEKSHIDMRNGIFIDDSTRNLKTSNAKHKILFGKEYPWNQDSDQYKRCVCWTDVYAEIAQIQTNELHGIEMKE